jgi:hypothetical protein
MVKQKYKELWMERGWETSSAQTSTQQAIQSIQATQPTNLSFPLLEQSNLPQQQQKAVNCFNY